VDLISQGVAPPGLDRPTENAPSLREPLDQVDILIVVKHCTREDFDHESRTLEEFDQCPASDRRISGIVEIATVRDEEDAANGRRLPAWSLAVGLGSGHGRGGWASPDASGAGEPPPHDDRKGQASKPEEVDAGERRHGGVEQERGERAPLQPWPFLT